MTVAVLGRSTGIRCHNTRVLVAPSPTGNSAFRNLRQENAMFKARLHSKFKGGLGYMVEPCHRAGHGTDQT